MTSTVKAMRSPAKAPFKYALKMTFSDFFPLLGEHPGVLLGLLIFNEAAVQTTNLWMQINPLSDFVRVSGSLLTFLIGLIVQLFMLIIVSQRASLKLGQPHQSLWNWVHHRTWYLTLESIRFTGFLLLWTMLIVPGAALFVVFFGNSPIMRMSSGQGPTLGFLVFLVWCIPFLFPAVVYYIRNTFFPFVILLDRDFPRDGIDPLKRSWVMTRGLLLVIFIIQCFSGVIQMLSSKWSYTESPYQASAAAILIFCANLFFSLLTVELYLAKLSGTKPEGTR